MDKTHSYREQKNVYISNVKKVYKTDVLDILIGCSTW